MDYHAFALGLSTGCPPTLSPADLAEYISELADAEDTGAIDAEVLRQAAQRLTASMTPAEIRARLMTLERAAGALYASANIYTLSTYNDVPLRVEMHFGGGVDVEARGADWPSALAELEAKIQSREWEAPKVEALAKDLLAGKAIPAKHEERFGERARARAKEMAEAFTRSTQPDAAE